MMANLIGIDDGGPAPKLGETFGDEIIAAALGSLPFGWRPDGTITGADKLTADQQAALKGVIAAHDPTKTRMPPVVTDRQFFQQLALMGTISQDEALAAVKTGAIPATLQTFINTLPADQKFSAEMLVSGAVSFNRSHPMTVALAAGMGWTDSQVDDLWRAAALL